MADKPRYEYRVERDIWGPARAEITLIRRTAPRGLLAPFRGRRTASELRLFHRTFKPRFELDELERYARELDQVARHGNEGSLGCFVDTRTHYGVVEVALYERWFDGHDLICDELASRRFDPEDEGAVVAGAEFVAELQDWAERRNDERDMSYLQSSVEDEVRERGSAERASAAHELASILARHSG